MISWWEFFLLLIWLAKVFKKVIVEIFQCYLVFLEIKKKKPEFSIYFSSKLKLKKGYISNYLKEVCLNYLQNTERNMFNLRCIYSYYVYFITLNLLLLRFGCMESKIYLILVLSSYFMYCLHLCTINNKSVVRVELEE